MRPVLVVGELLLIAGLAFMASQRQLQLVLVLPLGIGLILTFLRWPPLGIIVAALAGFVVPFQGFSGLNVSVILVALLIGIWLLDMITSKHQIQIALSQTVWPLIAFLIVGVLSFGIGQLPWFTFAVHAPIGAQLGGLAIVVLSAGIFLLVASRVNNLDWLKAITWAFLAFSVFAILIGGVLPALGLPTQTWIQPAGSVYFIWVVAMGFSQAAFNRDLHPGWRLAIGGLILYTLYDLFIIRFVDKSGWLPVLICIGVMIGLRSWRAGLVLIPVAAIAVFFLTTRVVNSEEYSVSTRFDAWLILAQIIKINPLLGLGFANYYWYTPLFPIRGYAVSFNSHNNYVDIVAQTGFVGLICLLLFFWQVGWVGWRLRNQVPSGFAQAYVYGALGGLAGMVMVGMMGDWIIPFFYNIGLSGFRSSMLGWLFLGGLVSLEQMIRSQKLNVALQ